MVSYFWFLPSDVNISIPTETEIQKRLENPLPAKYKSREEYETNYRKIHSPPTEKQMRKALQDAKIDDAAMDLQQVKYELHKLFAQHLIQTVEQLGEINQILRAYTHL
ncbi:MAG: hypothetical protein DHS20C20_16780 [Ardenticatenaceae bacterium]|nr:MAG: hypothetical protein DHS20C20_16780 [Ardenticatenaceae bacterium]